MPAHRVMVVEDDSEIREALVDVLGDHGYETLAARNGHEALDTLRASPLRPCLILLDLMMPVMDGWEFREHQRRTPDIAQIPVVVLSAYREVGTEVTDLGVDAFIRKPVKVSEVLDLARHYCAGPPSPSSS